MVPQPESVAQQRCRALASQNASSSFLFLPKPAKRPGSAGITYGKSARPLSLTGKQFRVRRETYDIPSEDDEGDDGASALLQATIHEDSEESSDSPLSGAEAATPVRLKKAARVSYGPSRAEVLEAAASVCRTLKVPTKYARQEKATQSSVLQRVYSPELGDDHDRAKAISKPSKAVKRSSPDTAVPLPPRSKSVPSARRLPVNELVCVPDPPQYDDFADPHSSVPGVQTQDPIAEFSSHPCGRKVSPMSDDSDDDDRVPKAPLTTLRKRLKTPTHRSKHKVIKRKQAQQPSLWGRKISVIKAGDGFEKEELHIGYRIPIRKQNKRKGSAIIQYGTLSLASGLLPEVAFECSTDELQLEPSGGPHQVRGRGTDSESETYVTSIEASEHSHKDAAHSAGLEMDDGSDRNLSKTQLSLSSGRRRQVSFSNEEQLIIAQLSSVSAPRREWSVSEDDEEESDDADDEENDEDVEGEANGDMSGDEEVYNDDNDAVLSDTEARRDSQHHEDLPPPNSPPIVTRRMRVAEDIAEEPTDPPVNNNGVTLNFRRQAFRGPSHRRSLGQSRLMEVDEAIVDVPDPVTIQVPRSDAVATQQAVISGVIPQTTSDRPHRPRSILKNSTPIVPESTYSNEDTAANTRRNSRRRTTMVEIEEDSRYFTQASDALRASEPVTHRIMPRRIPSSHFDGYVQVADSELMIPETSPDPEEGNYTTTKQLTVLRQDAEAVWTSEQSLPTVPRDLKSLTRTVSRENGTLSQSVRRRPSVPFQSPTKVR